MRLQFGPRHGDRKNWRRALVVEHDGKLFALSLSMTTKTAVKTITDDDGDEAEVSVEKREGRIEDRHGSEVWRGKVPTKGPPGHAFACAAGLARAGERRSRTDKPPKWLLEKVEPLTDAEVAEAQRQYLTKRPSAEALVH